MCFIYKGLILCNKKQLPLVMTQPAVVNILSLFADYLKWHCLAKEQWPKSYQAE